MPAQQHLKYQHYQQPPHNPHRPRYYTNREVVDPSVLSVSHFTFVLCALNLFLTPVLLLSLYRDCQRRRRRSKMNARGSGSMVHVKEEEETVTLMRWRQKSGQEVAVVVGGGAGRIVGKSRRCGKVLHQTWCW